MSGHIAGVGAYSEVSGHIASVCRAYSGGVGAYSGCVGAYSGCVGAYSGCVGAYSGCRGI